MAVNPTGWSTSAGSNGTVGGVNIAEGCLAANLNGGERAIMAGVKEMLDAIGGAKVSAGTADAQTLTTGYSLSAYAAGILVGFEAGAALTNTGAMTMAWDGLTAKNVKLSNGSDPPAGAVTAGGIYLTSYEPGADVIFLLNPSISISTSVTAASTITDNRIARGDGGSRGIQESLVVIDDTTGTTYPSSNDLGSLGKSGTAWSDLFLASGGVINWNAGNYTITHSADLLTFNAGLTVTGAIIGSSTFSIGTSNAATVGSIELGNASDTTISRSSAGIIAVETVAVPTISSTHTLTNKRVTPRVTSVASSATPTPNADTDDMYILTALAEAAAFAIPSGTPTQGQKLVIRIKDNSTVRALTWDAIYRDSSDLALPTTTVDDQVMYLGFIYDATATKWDLVAFLDNVS